MNEPTTVSRPPISVAICTRDCPAMIGRAVQSVLDQDYPEFDVVVLDQSRDDLTEEIVRALAAGAPRLRYLRLHQGGLSHAYNVAVAIAQPELLAFTDDDCVASPGWLSAVATAFAEHADAALVYGQVLGPAPSDTEGPYDGELPTLPIQRLERLSRKDGFRVFGMGADFAARRSAMRALGGFDEVLGGGGPLQSAQDFDLGYRVYRAGGTILLDPRIVVHHYGFRDHADWPKVIRSYGIGVGGFYLKHVRAGDPYAAALLAREWLLWQMRLLKRLLLRQPTENHRTYMRNLVAGMWRSYGYRVDRRRRLYVAPRTTG
jgi:glycosyltransferase involved in cell wall biosynthesis